MSIRALHSYARAGLGIMNGSRAFGGPLQANISLTDRCNIRCIHCYYYSPFLDKPTLPPLRKARLKGEKLPDALDLKQLQGIDADSERIRSIIDELLRLGTRRYQLSGRGETFLHKDILEFIGRLKHAGSYCLANTNGTLLDRATIDELITMSFDDLRITTMAGTADTYLRTHLNIPDRTFSILQNNLQYLSQKKEALGVRRPKMTVIFIVVAQNADSVFTFAEFAAHVGADAVLYRPVDDVKDPGLANLVPTQEQADSVRTQLSEAHSYLDSRGISHNIENFLKVFKKQLNTTALYHVIPCYYGWLSLMIQPDGEVYSCCRCYEPLGNIYEKKFNEIWNGEAYRLFRKNALRINMRKTPLSGCDCNSCVHHTANLRVYKALHPLKGRSARLRQLSPDCMGDEGQQGRV